MKRTRLCGVLLALCLLTTGCTRAQYIENQVYAVMMGVDEAEDGIEVTVRIPRLAGEESSAEDGGYMTVRSTGGSFRQALDSMKLGAARRLNLSALVLVAVSEKAARAGDLIGIMRTLISDYRAYSAVYFAVCQGDAGRFVESHKPAVGKRMSEGLTALVENDAEIGFIPESRLADVYYRTISFYSDPLLLCCAQVEDQDAEAEPGDVTAEELPVRNDTESAYLGAYVLQNGRLAGQLTGTQMLLIHAMNGAVSQFNWSKGKKTVSLSSSGAADVWIDVEKSPMEITVNWKLTAGADETERKEWADDLRRALEEEIALCQSWGAEPFGFADRAVIRFLTIPEFLEYDWHRRFAEARVSVRVEIG